MACPFRCLLRSSIRVLTHPAVPAIRYNSSASSSSPAFRRDASTSAQVQQASGQSRVEAESEVINVDVPSSSDSNPKKVKPKGKSRTPPKNRQRPPLPMVREADIEEDFMRGRGPGGQVINRRSMLVALHHLPTGIRVKCQETRSRESNRYIARKLLSEKVDAFLNGSESRLEQKWAREALKKKAKKRKGARKRREGGEAGDAEEEDQGGEVEGPGATVALCRPSDNS